jgi:glycosyltransferase involved in cell wall biosynthesis
MTVLGRNGGMDRVADLIIEALAARADLGIRVERLTTRGRGGFLRGCLVFVAALARFWLAGRRGQVDVLHIHLAAGGSAYRKLLLARLAWRLGIPYVVHLHGSRFHEFWPSLGPLSRRAVDRMFRDSARILVLGRFWAGLVVNCVPEAQSKITVFPNATRHHISCLGLLGPRKGTPQLIEALGRLAGNDNWRATLAGNGDVEQSRALVQKLGIADRIEIPGWLDETGIDAVLRRTEILVLPSFAENLPMAILEGFAHGLAVVATPVGAIPDVIDHDRNGLLVPVGDVEALTAAIGRLIENPHLRHKLGAAARQDHAERYDIKAYAPRLAAIWCQAVQSTPSGRSAAAASDGQSHGVMIPPPASSLLQIQRQETKISR